MTRVVLTYEDYAELPNDGKRYELHEGELSVTPAPGATHQTVLGNLHLILGPYVRAQRRGRIFLSPFDCIMTNITVVQPDLVYLDDERARLLRERGLEGAPTLAIEIISPSTGRIDRRTKLGLYARHDVPWYWIVDPVARSIEALHLEAGGYVQAAKLEGSTPFALPPFTDLQLDPAAIWT